MAFRLRTIFEMSRWSFGPRAPRRNTCLPEWSRSELPETSFFRCSFSFWQGAKPRTPTEGNRHMLSRCGLLSFWRFSGEVTHVVHLIRWNLKSRYMPLWLTWTRAWRGTTHESYRYLRTESWCIINCFGFLVCHQLVPHLVPNSPRVPLCNVSWGLGVCAVLVRSVSPCRLVLEVRLFPSPPRCFWPFALRVFAFFLPLAFQGWPGSGRVCVCNIWIDVKLLSFSFFCPLPF